MNILAGLVATAGIALAAVNPGLPARSSASDYPSYAADKGVSIGAEAMEPDSVRGSFSTDLSDYAVVEVSFYPKAGTPADLSSIDFALRVNGRLIRPVEPRSIAGIQQRRANSGRDYITLYPAVGVNTGSWGSGVGAGVGVGVGGSAPGPGSTDSDRRTMELELQEKELPEGSVTKPIAGYLYFPIGKRKTESAELLYQLDSVDLKVKIALKRP